MTLVIFFLLKVDSITLFIYIFHSSFLLSLSSFSISQHNYINILFSIEYSSMIYLNNNFGYYLLLHQLEKYISLLFHLSSLLLQPCIFFYLYNYFTFSSMTKFTFCFIVIIKTSVFVYNFKLYFKFCFYII